MRSVTRRAWLAASAAGALGAAVEEPTVRLPKKVRLGLIGLEGHPEEVTQPLRRLPDVELVAVAERAASLPRRLSRARHYQDYREMLHRERLDMVAVCNNNGERAAAVIACLERKLHVVAEKPLAIDRASLAKVRRAYDASGARLTAMFSMRFEPPYAAIKRVVDSGAIGEVAQIASQKSYKSGDRPDWFKHRATYGGTIPWIGIHMVDLMRWTGGREFTEAVSFQNRIGFPDLGDMENVTGSLFRLDNGGVAMMRMDFLRPQRAPSHGDDRLRLAGTKGVVEYQASTGVVLLTGSREPEVINDLPAPGSLFIDFLESVYLNKPAVLTEPDIFRVNEITLLATESADRHQIVRL